MADSECTICNALYDLDEHLPLILQCSSILCKSCAEFGYKENENAILCPFHDSNYFGNINTLKVCQSVINFLKETFIPCYYDDNKAVSFNIVENKALCQKHTNISQKNTEMRDLIVISLIKVFKSNKYLLSYEFKRIFSITLSQKVLEPILNFLYAILSYISNQPKFEIQDQNLDPCIDPKTFVIKSRNLAENQDLSQVLNEILSKSYKEVSEKNILCFSGVLKNYFYRQTHIHRILIEIEFMKKNYIKAIKDISCVNCNKGFKLGLRHPFYIPTCNHYICYTCTKTQNLCGICKSPIENIQPNNFDEVLYESPACANCINLNPISFDNLPFRSYCDCVYCEICIKHHVMTNCNRCLNIFGLNKEFQFKVCKKSLLTNQYMITDALCSQCNTEAGTKFSQKHLIMLCNTCFANNENKAELNCKRVDLTQNIDSILICIYNQLNQNDKIAFASSNLNRKFYMISKAKNLQFNYLAAEYNLYNLKIFKRFKVTYPVNPRDKRGFKILKNYSYGVEVSTNKNIRIFGAIIGGNPDFHGAKVKATLNVNGSEVRKEFNGKQGYLMGVQTPYGNQFYISIKYDFSGVISTGKYSDSPTKTHDQITFNFFPEKSSGQGPLLGLIYSDDP